MKIHRWAVPFLTLLFWTGPALAGPGTLTDLCPCSPKPVQKDIPYSNLFSNRSFDFYPTCPGNPLVIYIHGGGWFSGDKAGITPGQMNILNALRTRGYNVISANYRLTMEPDGVTETGVVWPGPINDIKCLLRFVAKNHAIYGNSQKIGLWGHSAGSHLGLMAAMTKASAGFDDDCEIPSSDPNAQYTIERIAATSPPADLTKCSIGETDEVERLFGVAGCNHAGSLSQADYNTLFNASPRRYATVADPPVLMVTGDDDPLILPKQNAGRLYDFLKNTLGRSSDSWTSYPGQDHNSYYNLPAAQNEISGFFPVQPASDANYGDSCLYRPLTPSYP